MMTHDTSQPHHSKHIAPTGAGHNVQIDRLIGVLTDQVRVLSEWSRVNLVDVKCIGKPSVFQNDESKFYEWVKKIENCLIRIDPHLEAMLTWALENETEIRQSTIADEFWW